MIGYGQKSKKEIFLDYIQSTFPVGVKRSRSAVIRQELCGACMHVHVVLHLKGNKDPDASFRH